LAVGTDTDTATATHIIDTFMAVIGTIMGIAAVN